MAEEVPPFEEGGAEEESQQQEQERAEEEQQERERRDEEERERQEEEEEEEEEKEEELEREGHQGRGNPGSSTDYPTGSNAEKYANYDGTEINKRFLLSKINKSFGKTSAKLKFDYALDTKGAVRIALVEENGTRLNPPIYVFNGKFSLDYSENFENFMENLKNNEQANRVALEEERDYIKKSQVTEKSFKQMQKTETALKEENLPAEEKATLEETLEVQKKTYQRSKKAENEAYEKLPLRSKIRSIFAKYGVGFVSIGLSVAAVVTAIVNAVANGAKKAVEGAASGAKALASKALAALPGMIGNIASFILKSAGEALSFLGENLWIAIVAVALFFIEYFLKPRTPPPDLKRNK